MTAPYYVPSCTEDGNSMFFPNTVTYPEVQRRQFKALYSDTSLQEKPWKLETFNFCWAVFHCSRYPVNPTKLNYGNVMKQ
jgi:hypothetical protein